MTSSNISVCVYYTTAGVTSNCVIGVFIFQSLDEIEKLYVDENLSVFERVYLLSSSSYDVQKIWAIEQLVSLLWTEKQNVLVKLLPKITVGICAACKLPIQLS